MAIITDAFDDVKDQIPKSMAAQYWSTGTTNALRRNQFMNDRDI